jgi:hypothetical protein
MWKGGSPQTAAWAHVGRIGVGVIAVFFVLVNVTDIVLAAGIHDLAGHAALVTTLWRLHWAIFIINLGAVALALLGLGLAASAAHLVGRYICAWSVAGALLLVAGAAGAVAGTNGFPVVAIALPAMPTGSFS